MLNVIIFITAKSFGSVSVFNSSLGAEKVLNRHSNKNLENYDNAFVPMMIEIQLNIMIVKINISNIIPDKRVQNPISKPPMSCLKGFVRFNNSLGFKLNLSESPLQFPYHEIKHSAMA